MASLNCSMSSYVEIIILTVIMYASILCRTTAFAAEKKTEPPPKFNPVTSIAARTQPVGSFSIQRAPVGNINSSMLSQSLSYSLLPRLEIGTAPLFYFSAKHRYNYVGKYNFWRNQDIDWAVSLSESRYRTEFSQDSTIETADLIMRAAQIAFNYYPQNSQWVIAGFTTSMCGYIDSKNPFVYIESLSCQQEYGMDIQAPLEKNSTFSFGIANLRQAGYSPWEEMSPGMGAAYSLSRQGAFFSRPSFGVYQSIRGQTLFLLSTTIKEK